jgi:hypothetical protein
MRQNDKILRYLTVRTDEDLKRAARRKPSGRGPAGTGGAGTGVMDEPVDDDLDTGEEV